MRRSSSPSVTWFLFFQKDKSTRSFSFDELNSSMFSTQLNRVNQVSRILFYLKWYSFFTSVIYSYSLIIIVAVFDSCHFRLSQSSIIITFEQQNFRFSKFSMITWRSCFLSAINNNLKAFSLSNCIVLNIFRLPVIYKFANICSNVIKLLKTSYFIKFCRSLRFRNMMKIRSNIRTLLDLLLIKYQIVIWFIFALVTEALLDLL